MKEVYTHMIFLIDRSGSMSSIQKDMIGGMKEFIKQQKKEEGKCTLTLSQFDDKYEKVFSLKPLNEVESIDLSPRGSTALIDSMCILIKQAGGELVALPENERPDKVMFVTITDGGENASHEYKSETLKEMIKHQEEKYNWSFVYLGANQDSFSVAGNLGMSMGSTINYNATTDGVNYMMNTLSSVTSTYRGSKLSKARVEFSKEEQEESEKTK